MLIMRQGSRVEQQMRAKGCIYEALAAVCYMLEKWVDVPKNEYQCCMLETENK